MAANIAMLVKTIKIITASITVHQPFTMLWKNSLLTIKVFF